MKISKRAEAIKILGSDPSFYIFPYCSGKYQWEGSQDKFVGEEVDDIEGVLAVYVVVRHDKNGPYAKLMSVCNRSRKDL